MLQRRLITWMMTGILMTLSGCGVILQNHNAGEVAEKFYTVQENPDAPFPPELFETEELAREIRTEILARTEKFGTYESRKRVGSNRRVTMDGQGRRETILYIFEVSCSAGTTRETLLISRDGAAEAFKIIEYHIEDIMRVDDPAPAGTSST